MQPALVNVFPRFIDLSRRVEAIHRASNALDAVPFMKEGAVRPQAMTMLARTETLQIEKIARDVASMIVDTMGNDSTRAKEFSDDVAYVVGRQTVSEAMLTIAQLLCVLEGLFAVKDLIGHDQDGPKPWRDYEPPGEPNLASRLEALA